MANLNSIRKSLEHTITRPIVGLVARTPLTPNALTWLGFCITIGAAALIVLGYPFWGGVTMLIAAMFDMLDGSLARLTGRTTRFGAILDSTLDRVSEALLLLAVLAVYAGNAQAWEATLTGVALLGSFMVSYIRARMEGMGIECSAGFFTRPERVAVLALGLLLSGIEYALIIAIAILAVFSVLSAAQRLLFAWQQTRE